MHNRLNSRHPGGKQRTGRLWQWFVRRRGVIATSVLRGVCYGTGTGAAGFAFWWIEHHP